MVIGMIMMMMGMGRMKGAHIPHRQDAARNEGVTKQTILTTTTTMLTMTNIHRQKEEMTK